MARLLTWPEGISINSLEAVDDPNIRNSGSNTTQDGSEQTFDGVGQVWAFRIGLTIAQGTKVRRTRGILDALMGGANAIRFKLFDPDVMSPAEAGIAVPDWPDWRNLPSQPWANGQPWSNGMPWAGSYPTVKVSASATAGATIVSLENKFWGHSLGIGDRFGFFPFHLGMYQVTEVISPGTYRVKYRLRKAIAQGDYATLFPTIALRPLSKEAARPPARNPETTEPTTITLVEVIDPYVRQYFTD